jgi:hypothetical protein
LVHKILTFYINGVLNCKCPAPGPKGYRRREIFTNEQAEQETNEQAALPNYGSEVSDAPKEGVSTAETRQ